MLSAALPEKYRPKQKRMDDRARQALNEIREMHREWRRNLEAGTAGNRLDDGEDRGTGSSSECDK